MVAGQFMGWWMRHAPARAGQIVRAELRQTDQFIAASVFGIARKEVNNVRVLFAARWYSLQPAPQPLRALKTHHACVGVKLCPKSFAGELVKQTLSRARCGPVEAGKKI